MRVEQADVVTIPKRDQGRSRAAYRDVFGLLVERSGSDVAGIQDSGDCRIGVARDPDGNGVILHRRYAPVG